MKNEVQSFPESDLFFSLSIVLVQMTSKWKKYGCFSSFLGVYIRLLFKFISQRLHLSRHETDTVNFFNFKKLLIDACSNVCHIPSKWQKKDMLFGCSFFIFNIWRQFHGEWLEAKIWSNFTNLFLFVSWNAKIKSEKCSSYQKNISVFSVWSSVMQRQGCCVR